MPKIDFYWMSLVIPALVLIPNLLWKMYPPVNNPSIKDEGPFLLGVFEDLGRVGVFVLPLFYPFSLTAPENRIYLNAMLILLAFYYAGWNRYFRGGRDYSYLYLPMFKIPIPLAVSPVLYFLLSAGLLRSIPMLIAAILLAIGHLPISYRRSRDVKHGL